jgi:hypothetical protein
MSEEEEKGEGNAVDTMLMGVGKPGFFSKRLKGFGRNGGG